MPKLTEHFTLEELSFTQHRELDNTPPAELIATLVKTAQGLERIRTMLKHSIHVNSGYRSPEVNAAIGSKPTSQHILGEAADFICPGFGTPAAIAQVLSDNRYALGIDQLILEYKDWVHVSFTDKPRHSVLTIGPNGTHVGLA